ncbi:MAG: allophanate hydrolase subunit 1 [Pseudomonadota bacterium]
MSGDLSISLCGDDTLHVRIEDEVRRNLVCQRLLEAGVWREVVATLDGVTVQFDPIRQLPANAVAFLREALDVPLDQEATAPLEIDIPVHYGGQFGPDLACVAKQLGVSEEDVIRRHTAYRHRVQMIGFTPGFAYLSSDGDGLDIPRLATPRPRIAAGSVGVMGGQSGLYALAGPGGWPIIGRTDAQLFQDNMDPPCALSLGMVVRFVRHD